MQEYMDCYEEVQNYLHLDENYDDSRDVTTTYLGTEHIYKTDQFNAEPSVPFYSNKSYLGTGSWRKYVEYSHCDRSCKMLHVKKLVWQEPYPTQTT